MFGRFFNFFEVMAHTSYGVFTVMWAVCVDWRHGKAVEIIQLTRCQRLFGGRWTLHS